MSQRQPKTPIHHEVGIPDKVIIVDYYVHKENKHENIVNNTRNNILSQSPATEGGEGESEI